MGKEYHRRILWALEGNTYREDREPEKPKYLVLLNPFGGAGAARRNWTIVEPLFRLAHV